MFKFFKIFAICLLFLAQACSDEKSSSQNVTNNSSSVQIYAQDSNELRHGFNIELADTTEKIGHGLMGRTTLNADSGMLFDINLVPRDLDIAFWMKDTLIPLDILFADEAGVIFFIHKNAEPNDTTPITPPKRPRVVLEINGGKTDEYGIKLGDMLKCDLLDNN